MGSPGESRRRIGYVTRAFWLLVAGAISAVAAQPQADLPAPIEATPPRPAAEPLEAQLVPGQTIRPIDLASALRLGGASDLDIAIARERVGQSMAELEQARVLWLPSLYLGPNWIRHDGQVQTVEGQIINDQQELAVPRGHRRRGIERLRSGPRRRACPGLRAHFHPPVLRRDLRPARREAGHRGPPRGSRRGDERRPARRGRGVLRPPAGRRLTRDRPRGRRQRRRPGRGDLRPRPERLGPRGRRPPQSSPSATASGGTSRRPSASWRSPRPSWSAGSGSTLASWSPRSSPRRR